LHKATGHLVIALILAVLLWLITPFPAVAQNVEEYFQFSYDSVSLSKDKIRGSEVFHVTILGRVACTKDLPVPVSEASIASRVVAEHKVGGIRVTLNSSYTLTIKPFPSKEGDTFKIDQVAPLQFPAQAESGDYNIVGEIIEAKIKIGFGWISVTEYLPQNQLMDSVKYTAPPRTPASASAPTPTPTTEPAPVEYGIPWWVWLIVAAAIVTTVFNIVWYLRHRIAQPTEQG